MDPQIRKNSKPSDLEDAANSFDRLPRETSLDILSGLPVNSLIQFRFACRSFYSLTRDPHLVDLHLSRSQPCLILHSNYPLRNQLHFLQLSGNDKVRKFDVPFIGLMPEFSIVGSSYGLLCLVSTLFPDSVYLYNPFTRDYRMLPKCSDFFDQSVVYGFGFDSVGRDYKAIRLMDCVDSRGKCSVSVDGVFEASEQVSEVRVYSLRANVWIDRGIVPYRIEKCLMGVAVSGRLHWVTRWQHHDGHYGRRILSYDLGDGTFHMITVPGFHSGSNFQWSWMSLAVLNGCLCASRGHRELDVWVMKEYGVDESWVKMYLIRAYYPVSMIGHALERLRRSIIGKKMVVVLCALESGELLLEYRGEGLVAYDPQWGVFRELTYAGMPRIYQAMVHVGSLVPVPTLL